MNPRFALPGTTSPWNGLLRRTLTAGVLSAALLTGWGVRAEPAPPLPTGDPDLPKELATGSAPLTPDVPEIIREASPSGAFQYESGPGAAKANVESAQARLAASARPLTPEDAGGPYPYLKRQPGWRSVAELFNPFAPLPRADETAALAFETRIPLRPCLPRIPSDAAWMEGGLSLLSFAAPR